MLTNELYIYHLSSKLTKKDLRETKMKSLIFNETLNANTKIDSDNCDIVRSIFLARLNPNLYLNASMNEN